VVVVIPQIHVQVIVAPANCIGGGDSPEIPGAEVITRRVGIVINRVGARIIVVDRVALINNDLLRLVIGDINHFLIDRCDFDRAVFAADHLILVCLQVAGQHRAVTESLDRLDDFCLLV